LARRLIHTDPDESILRYVGRTVAAAWPTTAAAIDTRAADNLDVVLFGATLHIDDVDGHPLAWLESSSPSKASTIYAPSLKALLSERLSWPAMAVAPARDFVLFFPEKSAGHLRKKVGQVVVKEFTSTPYPVTPEILRIDDQGVVAIGSYLPD
jgi:hypothetical protein